MSNPYSSRNAEWRGRLAARARRLTDAQMDLPAGGPGWTVKVVLGHLAFWDRRAIILLDRWKQEGISPSAVDINAINDSMRPFLAAIPGPEVKRLAREAAEAIDAAIDALDPGLLSKIETDGKPVRLDRAAHREHHLAQIEKALSPIPG